MWAVWVLGGDVISGGCWSGMRTVETEHLQDTVNFVKAVDSHVLMSFPPP